MAVFAGDVVCVLEHGAVEDFMEVVLDWSGYGVASGFFRHQLGGNRVPELFLPGVSSFFRHLCPVHPLPVERPAAFPVKTVAEMGGDWRRDDVCPFPVPYPRIPGDVRRIPYDAEVFGGGLMGRRVPGFVLGNCPVLFIGHVLFHLPVCGSPLGGEKTEKRIRHAE